MANLILEQQPKYDPFPVTQPVIFTVSDSTVVANQFQVKFVANVYVHNEISSIASYKVATLKTTPNNVGVGMFDLNSILESYVNADNLPTGNSTSTAPTWAGSVTYKTVPYGFNNQFPIHLVDKFCMNNNSVKWLTIKFEVEYLGADTTNPNIVATDGDFLWTPNYLFYNGYLTHTDALQGSTYSNNFGWDLENAGTDIVGNELNFIQNSSSASYLSTMPTTLYARKTDYCTIATFTGLTNPILETGSTGDQARRYLKTSFKMYDSSDSLLTSFDTANLTTNGGSG